jgi:hypothetical protein
MLWLDEHIVAAHSLLIWQAQEIQTGSIRGLIDLNFEYAQYAAVFKASLAGDMAKLADEAHVCEKAAFLTLIRIFEE